jgi:hypothetical protein
MKKLHLALVGMAGLASALALYYNVATEASQAGSGATQFDIASAPSAGTSGSTSESSTNGATEYRNNLAIAAHRIDEQNPLRSYEPTPEIAGAMPSTRYTRKGSLRRRCRRRWHSGFYAMVN